MKRTKLTFKIIGLAITSLLLFSCNPLEKDYKSNSFIIIENIVGKDQLGNDSSVVFSDVAKIVNGQPVFYSDFVTVTLQAALLDPNPIMGASQYNDIMLTRYVVTYTRSDGATAEGTAVPYHFEGNLSTRLKIGSSVTVPIMIVRDIAKNQPPLNALIGDRTGMLEGTARIDFYGHDLRNREVTQTGYITVRFADYLDQE
jgi:hypothetical protein